MFGLYVEKLNEDYFTDFSEIFDALGNIAKEYNWLISDYMCNVYPLEKIKEGREYVWLSGDEIVDVLRGQEIQFIWGVFSAFKKVVKLDDILKYPLPFADGNPSFREENFSVQNPLADFEIISVDSTCLLAISKTKDIIDLLAKEYPDSVDLREI